ncbi:DUF2529 family protein [Evansella sp. AB-P1]|uniref:DUF2529 family protein n=1 Tax=Evansella sp. AB-P1 TaxID=3037653 RepID=UPI00241C5633|nr:DUF2529 family protein [Evansella sp. AB-P1]MDG5787349.1 DUF2529 family protein [Evansella sp. AB-P1]
MKIFQTQVQGLLNRFTDIEDELEDAARMIAQSIISEGKVWIFGEKEMKGIIHQAVEGEDSFPNIMEGTIGGHSTQQLDTVIVFSPDPHSQWADHVVSTAKEVPCNVIGVSSERNLAATSPAESNNDTSWGEKCDLFFSTGVKRGLVPTESGQFLGHPHLLVGLHIYYLLYLTTMEFLEEHGYFEEEN